MRVSFLYYHNDSNVMFEKKTFSPQILDLVSGSTIILKKLFLDNIAPY